MRNTGSVHDHEPSRGVQALATGATTALVGLAGLSSLFLGTLGYFGLQFGIMTGCTNEYFCTETLCSPCVAPFTWLTVGAGVQLLLLAGLVVVTWRFWRRQRRSIVAGAAAAILVASIATVVVTTNAADGSYARASAASPASTIQG
jgi:phosphoglycerol transferase MdoB-like AlkP superfamily enzyme